MHLTRQEAQVPKGPPCRTQQMGAQGATNTDRRPKPKLEFPAPYTVYNLRFHFDHLN